MTPEEYWKKFQIDIKEFEEKKVEPSDDKDAEQYKKLKDTLAEIAELTLEAIANKCGSRGPLAKVDKLLADEKIFGSKKNPLVISGKQSYEFIQDIYRPHLLRMDKVEFGLVSKSLLAIFSTFGSAKTPEQMRILAKRKADYLSISIAEYEKSNKTSVIIHLKG